jgi:hypothetical protein
MSAPELLWRASRSLQSHRLPLAPDFTAAEWSSSFDQFRLAHARPLFLDRSSAQHISQNHPDLVAELLLAADSYVNNKFQFFAYPEVQLHSPIQWNHDPFSAITWPSIPSRQINYRFAPGDVKWIWELNRLQHLPLLAQAWLFTDDPRYSIAFFDHLDSWIQQNPPGFGICWSGGFEAGLRSISIAIAFQAFRDCPELTLERYCRITSLLVTSAQVCWQHRSLFSSSNNHLIGEMAGLATIAILHPDLPSAALQERRALDLLASASAKLIQADGSGAEQSIAYQITTVELLLLVAALLYRRDGTLADDTLPFAIRRSSSHLRSLIADDEPDPRYGDADHQLALRLGTHQSRTLRQHLSLVSSSPLSSSVFSNPPLSLDDAWYRFLYNSLSTKPHPSPPVASASTSSDYYSPQGGLVVLRRSSARLIIDVGPLGYESIAAHGHADALSITLSCGPQEVVSDPGTGSYYRHPDWRRVFRSTRSHSTLTINHLDQSTIAGPFLWNRHARTLVRMVDLSNGVVDAEHDGYSHLPGRVIHRRWLVAPPSANYQLVVDLVTGSGHHQVLTNWPLHPDISALRDQNHHLLSLHERPLLCLHHAASKEVHFIDSYGDEQSGMGWWSNTLESRVPAWWLTHHCNSELPLAIATLFDHSTASDLHSFSVSLSSSLIHVSWTQGVNTCSVIIDPSASGRVHLT